MKKIVILDGKTLGNIDLEKLNEIGEVDYYEFTSEDEVSNRIKDANIILTNKVILNEDNMKNANKLEFIAETATGFNNIDVDYARKRGIGVSNVAGYSTNAVVQHTFAMALGLLNEVILVAPRNNQREPLEAFFAPTIIVSHGGVSYCARPSQP